MAPSAQRRAKTLSSKTGTIRPEYPHPAVDYLSQPRLAHPRPDLPTLARRLARSLRVSPRPARNLNDGHHDLANDVRRFVERMPPAKTEREQIAHELQQRVVEMVFAFSQHNG